MKVQRWYQVLIIIIPIVIALPLLLFSIFTEWWSHTDNLILAKNQKIIEFNTQKTYIKTQHQIKFYKLSNLFSSCYDYKWINLLVPLNSNVTSGLTANCLDENKCLETPCFCCKTNQGCCIEAIKTCNFKPECFDNSDELDNAHECSAIQTGFFKIKYYDKINMCYREKYDYIGYIKNGLKNKFKFNYSDNNESEVFTLNFLALFSLLSCAAFTVASFICILFIKCCSYKTESTVSVKAEYYDNYNKRNNLIGTSNQNKSINESENDDEDDDDSEYTASKSCCCKCTYILCPFIFYNIFLLS